MNGKVKKIKFDKKKVPDLFFFENSRFFFFKSSYFFGEYI